MSKASDLRINAVWTRFAQGLQNTRYIAPILFPIIAVPEADMSGKIPLVSDENFEPSQVKRAPHGKTPIVNGRPLDGFAEYSCELNTLAYGIDFTERKGKVLDLYRHGTMVVAEKVLLSRELRSATLARNASLYTSGNTSSPSNAWTDQTNGDPITDLNTAIGVVETNVGDVALQIVMGTDAWRSFKNHVKVKAMLSGDSQKVITTEVAAQILEVDAVHVGRSVQKDPATGARVKIWGDDVIIFGNHPPAGQRTLYTASYGWTPAVEGFDQAPPIDTFKSEDGLVEYVRAYTWEDTLFHGQKLGYLLTSVN